MKLKVDGKSKAGTGIVSNKVWYNLDRKSGVSFDDVSRGDLLEVEVNPGTTFITKLTKLSGGSAEQPSTAVPTPSSSSSRTPGNEERMARSVAVKSVFESPSLAEQLKSGDISATVSELKAISKEVTRFILTGDFKETENNQ